MKNYDVIVIGGGLLGCFALRALMRYDITAALIEQREDLCTGISRANTAIIYSGCDTKPDTLKTSMCVRASQNFGSLCDDLGVRYHRCGSLMVSFGPCGDESLRRKYEQGQTNGVRGIGLLSGNETLSLEPGLSPDVKSSLYIPDTGTVNPWELCLAAAENASANGAKLHLNTEVSAVVPARGGYIIKAGGSDYFARGVINCAGLNSDKIHEMLSAPSVRVVPTIGDYLVLDTKADGAVKHIIFHEPEERGKGLTIVPTVDGNILLGPTEQDYTGDEQYASSRNGADLLHKLAEEVVPSLPMEHLIRSFGAMRPNPYSVTRGQDGGYAVSDRSINDFCIISPEDNPGVISLIGIKTPGLTCAHELGLHVSDMMANKLGFHEKSDFDPKRITPIKVSELPFETRAALVQEKPAYGKIVCRCREITEGDIIDAIRRYPGAVTLDGVKRRTCATSGRCQGSFCSERIIEILARETGRPPEGINKDGPGSHIIFGGKRDGA